MKTNSYESLVLVRTTKTMGTIIMVALNYRYDGKTMHPIGPFAIRIENGKIYVDKAELKNPVEIEQFKCAFDKAYKELKKLQL